MKLIITDIENFSVSVDGEYKLINPHGKIKNCIGCFGCWVKTPGKCVINDGYENTGIDMSRCTDLIIVSRCCYGSFSPFVKNVLDRAISYVHPDFRTYKGKMHHKRRYNNELSISAYLYGEEITEAEKATMKKVINGNADNFSGTVRNVCFYNSEELENISL